MALGHNKHAGCLLADADENNSFIIEIWYQIARLFFDTFLK